MSRPSADETKHEDHVDQAQHYEMKSVADVEKADPHIVDESWVAKERKLVRKLDLTLMPMVWVLYLFNYLDRNNIAWVPCENPRSLFFFSNRICRQAKLDSFEADLGLEGSDFNVAVSILNVGSVGVTENSPHQSHNANCLLVTCLCSSQAT